MTNGWPAVGALMRLGEWRSRQRRAQARVRFPGFAVLALLGGICAAMPAARAAESLVRFPASMPYQGSTVSLAAEIYWPGGTARAPAVVMMHGCGGWQAAVRHALRQHAMFLRQHGFVVLNLDSFGPRGIGGGAVCESIDKLQDARGYRLHDAFDALRYLRDQDKVDPRNIFLVGQSNGGSVALLAAASGAARGRPATEEGFRAAVAYYPWCDTLGTTQFALAAPLLVLAGARDDWTPPDSCQRFNSRGAPVRVKIYPEAAHSFDLRAPLHRYLGKLVGWDREAAEDSQREMLGFFRNHMSGESVGARLLGSIR